MRRVLVVLAVAAAAASGAVPASEGPQNPAPTRRPSRTRDEVSLDDVEGTVHVLSLRLFQMLRDVPGNLVVAPLFAYAALSLVRDAAAGSTAQQVTTTLEMSPDPVLTDAGYRQLITSLERTGDASLYFANKFYLERDSKSKKAFHEVASENYYTQVEEINFAGDTENVRILINQWVQASTEETILDILAPGTISPSTKLVVVNGASLRAGWWKPFEEAKTTVEPFHLDVDSKVYVRMMHENFQLYHGDIPHLNSQALTMSYKSGSSDLHMVLLLPNDLFGLEQLEEGLPELDFNNLTPRFVDVQLSLPAFKIESTTNFKKILMEMGITKLFEHEANLSNLADKPLYLDEIVHKASITIHEEGTESGVSIGTNYRFASMYDFVEFKVDHPFLFLIRRQDTILFIGRVTHPTA